MSDLQTEDNPLVLKHTGFTESQLRAAFELVQNPADWKAAIDSYVSSDELKVVAAAIEFFTGTTAKFDYIRLVTEDSVTATRFKAGDHILKVRADGYRRGPAGDH